MSLRLIALVMPLSLLTAAAMVFSVQTVEAVPPHAMCGNPTGLAATCGGDSGQCNACKNCKYCGWCSSPGRYCSVCR